MNNLPLGSLSDWFFTDYYLVLFDIIIYTPPCPRCIGSCHEAARRILLMEKVTEITPVGMETTEIMRLKTMFCMLACTLTASALSAQNLTQL